MTLSALRYLVAVARERHFGRAAERCHVSQPTLSVAIKKLEEELGVAVFERSRQEVALTAVGERIVIQAQRVLEEAEAVKALARADQDPLVGSLRLGVIYTIGPYLLPHLIPLLHERAPQMPLIIQEHFTARLSELLKQGELDVILVALPYEEPGVVTRAVYDEPFMVVMPASHPWREREVIDSSEMAEENLLLLGAGHCFRDQVLNACPACNRRAVLDGRLQKSVEGSSLETIRHMVASGMGITVLPCSAVGADRYEQPLLTVRRFAPPAPQRRVALAWRRSFTRPAAIDALYQAIIATNMRCVSYEL